MQDGKNHSCISICMVVSRVKGPLCVQHSGQCFAHATPPPLYPPHESVSRDAYRMLSQPATHVLVALYTII